MKTILLSSIFLFSIFSTFGQNKTATCHNRDKTGTTQIKSNSLSISQISETEKYDVNYYGLDIEMDNLSTHVQGTGDIHGTSRVAMDSVLFELFPSLTISEIRLNGSPTPFSINGSAIKVPVNIVSNQPFELSIDYSGTPPNAVSNPLGGSGMTNATSPSWGKQVTWSLSESFAAYEWWPCKQSLTDKADSCKVFITVPNNCMAGSNGTLLDKVDLGNGKTRYEWVHNNPIVYYLISVAIAEYQEYNVYANPAGSTGPVLIQNFIYNNSNYLPTYQNDIDETVEFIELFADLFGPYPFQDEKYGHCIAPLSGGMEHQTMTTQGWFEKGLTAHELGHQWWGDNITCASWADIWVNEGFASYSEYLMRENLYPGETVGRMNEIHTNVMSQNGGSVWCEDSLNESQIFSGRLSYDKGSAIIHTFRFIMNDDVNFFQALKNIQADFGDSTAYGLDIRDYFSAASGVDFSEPFNEWYFGEGYPTYSAKWNEIGGDLFVQVTHSTSSTTPTFTNPLEIEFSRPGNTDTIVRLDITANSNFFSIPNVGNVNNLTAIDPNNWIINKVGSISQDGALALPESNGINDTYTIFPNPSNGIFEISSDFSGTNEIVILDIRGRKISDSSFNKQGKIDLTKEVNGYYILQITNEQGEKRVKTILKN